MKIFFLPDPDRCYEGIQVNNVRRAISSDPMVTRYLSTFDERFDVLNQGPRRYQHAIHLDVEDLEKLNALEAKGFQILCELMNSLPPIGPYSPCPCGSGSKLKWCHKDANKAT